MDQIMEGLIGHEEFEFYSKCGEKPIEGFQHV